MHTYLSPPSFGLIQRPFKDVSRQDGSRGSGPRAALFDLALVGYFTLGADRVICNANLAGAGMLDRERSDLAGQCFAAFVAGESRAAFSALLAQIFLGQCKERRMLTLTGAGTSPDVSVFACIEASATESKSTRHVVAVD